MAPNRNLLRSQSQPCDDILLAPANLNLPARTKPSRELRVSNLEPDPDSYSSLPVVLEQFGAAPSQLRRGESNSSLLVNYNTYTKRSAGGTKDGSQSSSRSGVGAGDEGRESSESINRVGARTRIPVKVWSKDASLNR